MKAILDQLKKETKTLLSDLGIKKQATTFIGLDLGSKYFRAVRVRRDIKELPLKDTLVKELRELKNIARDMKIDPEERVSINFKGEGLVIKRVSVPVMPREEIEGALRWELKEELPFSIDNSKLKFSILKEEEVEDGSKKLHLIAVVYKESEVEEKVKELKGFGLNVQSVIPTEVALTSYVNNLNLISAEEIVAIIDIGSTETKISIIEGRKLSFTRSLSIGGDSFTEAMSGVLISDKGKLELTKEEAEKIKYEEGIPEDIRLLSMIRPVLERLSSQLKGSLEYCEQQFKCSLIKKVILTGGGSRLKGLKGYLSREVGVEVIYELPEIGEAVGLTLASQSAFNILPEKFKGEEKKRLKRISLRMLSVLFSSIFLIFYGFLLVKAINLKNELAIYRSHLETLKDVELIKNKMLLFSSTIVNFSSNDVKAGTIMRELTNLIPNSIALENLDIKDTEPNVRLRGVVYKEDEQSSFMSNLERSNVFENVKLLFTEKKDEFGVGSLQFELTANFTR